MATTNCFGFLMPSKKRLVPRPPNAQPDPFDLSARFVSQQRKVFSRALAEIQRGCKSSHWMWFVIPTPPFVVGGEERGSMTNREYALRDHPPNNLEGFQAARAYLDFPEEEGVHLRSNLVLILSAIITQLDQGKSAVRLMGALDEPKLRSAAKLFESVSRPSAGGGTADEELNGTCRRLLALLNEPVFPGVDLPVAAASDLEHRFAALGCDSDDEPIAPVEGASEFVADSAEHVPATRPSHDAHGTL